MREPGFWYPARRGTVPAVARLLAPAGYVYGVAGRMKRRMTKPERAAVPVVCIGNITAGGAGKTPVAMTVAERLAAKGEHVHFLPPRYGGPERGPTPRDPPPPGPPHTRPPLPPDGGVR